MSVAFCLFVETITFLKKKKTTKQLCWLLTKGYVDRKEQAMSAEENE